MQALQPATRYSACQNTQKEACTNQKPRLTESAAAASFIASVKNAGDCPLNSPSAVHALTVATAPPVSVKVGRITEHTGRLLLMQFHGYGRILLVWVSFVGGLLRFGYG